MGLGATRELVKLNLRRLGFLLSQCARHSRRKRIFQSWGIRSRKPGGANECLGKQSSYFWSSLLINDWPLSCSGERLVNRPPGRHRDLRFILSDMHELSYVHDSLHFALQSPKFVTLISPAL